VFQAIISHARTAQEKSIQFEDGRVTIVSESGWLLMGQFVMMTAWAGFSACCLSTVSAAAPKLPHQPAVPMVAASMQHFMHSRVKASQMSKIKYVIILHGPNRLYERFPMM
jgi:hypothetical protein